MSETWVIIDPPSRPKANCDTGRSKLFQSLSTPVGAVHHLRGFPIDLEGY
jgi:hypothetical protein